MSTQCHPPSSKSQTQTQTMVNDAPHSYSYPYPHPHSSDISTDMEYSYINSPFITQHHPNDQMDSVMEWESVPQKIPGRVSSSTLPLIQEAKTNDPHSHNDSNNTTSDHLGDNNHQIDNGETGAKAGNPINVDNLGKSPIASGALMHHHGHDHAVQVAYPHSCSPWSSTSQHLLTPQYPFFPSITTPYPTSSSINPATITSNNNGDSTHQHNNKTNDTSTLMSDVGADSGGNDHQWRHTVLEASASLQSATPTTTISQPQYQTLHPHPLQQPSQPEGQGTVSPMLSLSHDDPTSRSLEPTSTSDRDGSFEHIHPRPTSHHHAPMSSSGAGANPITPTSTLTFTPTQASFNDGVMITPIPTSIISAGPGADGKTMDPKMTMWGRSEVQNDKYTMSISGRGDRISVKQISSLSSSHPHPPSPAHPHPHPYPYHHHQVQQNASTVIPKPKIRARRSTTSSSHPTPKKPLTTTTPLRKKRPAKLHLPPPSANMHYPIPQPLYSAPAAPISLDLLTCSGSGSAGSMVMDTHLMEAPPKVDGWVRPEDRPIPPLGYSTPIPIPMSASFTNEYATNVDTETEMMMFDPTLSNSELRYGQGLPQNPPGSGIGMEYQPRSVPMSRTWSAPYPYTCPHPNSDSRHCIPPQNLALGPSPLTGGGDEYMVTPGVNGLKVIPWRPYPTRYPPPPPSITPTSFQPHPHTYPQLPTQPLPQSTPIPPSSHAQIDVMSGQIIPPQQAEPLSASSSESSDWPSAPSGQTKVSSNRDRQVKVKRKHLKKVLKIPNEENNKELSGSGSGSGVMEDDKDRVKCHICNTSIGRQSDLQVSHPPLPLSPRPDEVGHADGSSDI